MARWSFVSQLKSHVIFDLRFHLEKYFDSPNNAKHIKEPKK